MDAVIFKRKIHSFLTKVLSDKKTLINQQKSYSQCGEDLIVRYIFSLKGIRYPSYIDIGANDPHSLSNTAIFYFHGSRGINIEANPLLLDQFKHYRPEDINLNIGVGLEKGTLPFYVMEDDTLSTFSKKEYDSMTAFGKTLRTILNIQIDTIESILLRHFNGKFPDFMSIDVEGMDFEIIKSINFEKFSPKVICVEAAEYSPFGTGKRRDDLINYLVTKDYFEYANTNLNAIMVKRDFWFR